MNLPTATDEQLMAALAAGDEAAFQELFRRYAPILLGLMRRDLARPQDAEDLVQDAFLQLYRARHDFRPDARLRPWLMTIALNLKREYFRRHGRRKEAPLELDGRSDPADVPADPTEASETAREVQQALRQLPDNQREVVDMHWFGGLSFPEIAAALGTSLSAAKVRAHRGYLRLRELLVKKEAKP